MKKTKKRVPSLQATFNKVVRAILRQGRPSYEPGKGCLYRGPDGCRCAAGVLIPDKLYSPSMEHLRVAPDGLPGKVIEKLGYDLTLVQDLQCAHDEAAEVDGEDGPEMAEARRFKRRFAAEVRKVAKDHDLSTSVLRGYR